jgi:hypothetical protein
MAYATAETAGERGVYTRTYVLASRNGGMQRMYNRFRFRRKNPRVLSFCTGTSSKQTNRKMAAHNDPKKSLQPLHACMHCMHTAGGIKELFEYTRINS